MRKTKLKNFHTFYIDYHNNEMEYKTTLSRLKIFSTANILKNGFSKTNLRLFLLNIENYLL